VLGVLSLLSPATFWPTPIILAGSFCGMDWNRQTLEARGSVR
jgi:hypothetical protein